MMDKLTGSKFYVARIDEDFVNRIYNWLDYLGISDFFPNLKKIDKIREVGDTLRDFGLSKAYGMAHRGTGNIIIRPGDFVSLLHEEWHTDKKLRKTALSSEAGALAAQVFSTGDYKRAQEDFLHSTHYTDEQKQAARVLTEATLVAGREIFEWLKKTKKLKKQYAFQEEVDYVTLIHYLGDKINEFEQNYKKNPTEYLVEIHRVPEEVAEKIIETTGHGIETIITSIDDTKKNMIGAFKGLASFLHINLNYPLDDAIKKTLEMFKDEEAMTINQTLYKGSKEVFARFEEYNAPRELTIRLVDKLISDGSDYARLYGERFPQLLDFSQKFGPNGWAFLNKALRDPGLTYMLLNQGGIEGLNHLYDKDPSIVKPLLKHLAEIDWNFEKSLSDIYLHKLSDDFQKLTFKLDSETKGKLLAIMVALESMSGSLEDKIEKLSGREITIRHYAGILKNMPISEIKKRLEIDFNYFKDMKKLAEKIKKLPP